MKLVSAILSMVGLGRRPRPVLPQKLLGGYPPEDGGAGAVERTIDLTRPPT
jgi:hypothetical protein